MSSKPHAKSPASFRGHFACDSESKPQAKCPRPGGWGPLPQGMLTSPRLAFGFFLINQINPNKGGHNQD